MTKTTPRVPTKPALSYNDRVRAAYAGEAARRRLNDLRPCLYADAVGFGQTGKPATVRNVTRFLAARGTVGAVASYVAEILAHQMDVAAMRAEFAG